MRSIKEFNVKNKRVLVRVDFDVDTDEQGNIIDDFRIKKCLPTIKYLVEQQAKVILMGHLDRPEGKKVEKLKMNRVQLKLLEYLDYSIVKADDCIGKKIEKWTKKMMPGEILLLENLRFHSGETRNSKSFAKNLAKLGDIYVNESFATCHREHASIVGVTNYLPKAAGLNLQKEIIALDKALKNPERPLTIIIGGAKVKTKIKVINKFLNLADKILIGGALPNTVLAAQGKEVGQSLVDKNAISEIKKINLENSKIQMPIDFNLSAGNKNRISSSDDILKNEKIYDIGPKTIALFASQIKQSRTIIFNGPVGVVEEKPFDKGSKEIVQAIIKNNNYSIVGGGDTVSFIRKLKLEDKFNHISTGGGAMLEYIINETLSGIKAL